MRPYYHDGRVSIYHGDAREVLPALKGLNADLILADPPYGETSLTWDHHVEGWSIQVGHAAKLQASLWCFGSLRSFLTAEDPADWCWRLAQDVIWEKHNGSSFHADRFRRVHEIVAQFYKTNVLWDQVYKDPQYSNDATKRTVRRKERPPHTGEIANSTYVSQDGGPRLMRSVIQVRSEHGRAVHPTQKPLGVLTPLIEYSCPVGGVVLDPFMGSGSTLVAARLIGRFAVGIEIDERYCEAAAKRLQQSVLPLDVPA